MLPAPDASVVAALSAALQIGPAAAKVLVHRGFSDPAAARRFLHPAFEELHDPLTMRDMPAAIERIARAIRERERILIYGDYDVDGTTSVVLLTKAFELAGGIATYHVPHRLKDGYGMRPEVVEAAAEQGVKLIVSVDTGIRAAEVVRRANELGIDVIVTDHHLPETDLPPALAVLNPNRPDCPYPEKNLCGAGVAFKLIQALLPHMGWPADKVRRVAESFLKLAAIATVADVVPLTGENRIIVSHGLRGLGTGAQCRTCARCSMSPGFTGGAAAQRAPGGASRSAPRINAAGRMDTAERRDRTLPHQRPRARPRPRQTASTIRTPSASRWKPRSVDYLRTDRRRTPPNARWSTTPKTGIAACSASWPAAWWSACTAPSSCWDAIRTMAWRRARAAASLRSTCWTRWNRCPTSSCDSAATRTPPASPWKSANVEEFRRRFNAFAASRLCADDFLRRLEIDAVLELREISEQAIEELFTLAPFGHGNPPPLFAALGVEVAAPPTIMKEKHLRITVRQNGRTLVLKAWNLAHRAAELVPGARVDVAFNLEEDAYSAARGYPPWAAILRDFRPA